jgi:hypothetical protein
MDERMKRFIRTGVIIGIVLGALLVIAFAILRY